MFKIVEYKIRKPGISRWEETPVFKRKELSGSKDEIQVKAKEMVEGIAFSEKSAVRWNYEGLEQGHYVDEIFPDGQGIIVEERIALRPKGVQLRPYSRK